MGKAVAAGLSHPVAQQDDWGALERLLAAQKASRGRTVVRFTRFTTQPLDPDNHVGSVKAALDCLRQSFPALLPDDNPEIIDLRIDQVRVSKKEQQGTLIEIG